MATPATGRRGSGKDHGGAAPPAERRQLRQRQEGDGARCSPRVKECAAKLGSGQRLQVEPLTLQLPMTEERGMTAPALVNGDLRGGGEER
jgi:hypothetical protein